MIFHTMIMKPRLREASSTTQHFQTSVSSSQLSSKLQTCTTDWCLGVLVRSCWPSCNPEPSDPRRLKFYQLKMQQSPQIPPFLPMSKNLTRAVGSPSLGPLTPLVSICTATPLALACLDSSFLVSFTELVSHWLFYLDYYPSLYSYFCEFILYLVQKNVILVLLSPPLDPLVVPICLPAGPPLSVPLFSLFPVLCTLIPLFPPLLLPVNIGLSE